MCPLSKGEVFESSELQEIKLKLQDQYREFNKTIILDLLRRAYTLVPHFHLQIPLELRYIVRKWNIVDIEIAAICEDACNTTLTTKTRQLLFQTLKYIAKNKKYIDPHLLFNLFEQSNNSEIKSEIIWILYYLLQYHSVDGDVLEKIRHIANDDISCPAKEFLKSELGKAERLEILMDEDPITSFHSFIRTTRQADTVRNRQTTKLAHIRRSQKEALEPLNELESLKKKNRIVHISHEVTPSAQEREGDDRHWYNGTYYEVRNLYTIACDGGKLKRELKKDDKDNYLPSKLFSNDKYFAYEHAGSFFIDRMIVRIFRCISTKQELHPSAITKLILCIDDPSEVIFRIFRTRDQRKIAKWIACKSVCKKKYHGEPGVVGEFADRILSEGIHNIYDGWFSFTFDRNYQQIERMVNTEIESMRIEAIEAIYETIRHDRKILSEEEVKAVGKCLKDSNTKVKKIAIKILEELDGAKISVDSEGLFNAYLEQMENNIDPDEAINYLFKKISNRESCQKLFTEEVLQRIVDCFDKQDLEDLIKIKCADLLGFYLEQTFTKGFSLSLLKKVLAVLHKEKNTKELKFECLKMLLFNAEKTRDLPDEIVQALVQDLNVLDGYSANLIIIMLDAISKVKDESTDETAGGNITIIQNCSSLAFKLSDETVVVQEGLGDFQFVKRTKQNEKSSSISAITANIFINTLKKGVIITMDAMRALIDATHSSDKQTRIRAANALYLAVQRKAYELDEQSLMKLQEVLLDPIPDVSVYTTVVYVKSLLQSSLAMAIPLSSAHIDLLPTIYALEEIQLEETVFTTLINETILSILSNEARKEKVHFSQEIFQLLNYLLSFEENRIKCLEIIKHYTNRRGCLPKKTIVALENMIGEGNVSAQVLSILEKVIENGQPVGERTLQAFADHLYFSEDEKLRNHVLQVLCCADGNQDLPDKIFSVLELEMAGKRVACASSQEARAEDLMYLEHMTAEGSKLPLNTLIMLCSKIDDTRVLSILNNIACRGQRIPEVVLSQLSDDFDLKKSSRIVLSLFSSVLRNSQKIPERFFKKLEEGLDVTESESIDVALELFALWGKKEGGVSEKVIRVLCSRFLKTDNIFVKQECLSAICCALQQRDGIQYLCCAHPVLVRALNEQNSIIIKRCLKYLESVGDKISLPEFKEIVSALIQKVVDNLLEYKQDILKLLDSCKLTDEQKATLKLAALETESDEVYLKTCSEICIQFKNIDFLLRNFQRLDCIIKNSPQLQKQVLEILLHCHNKKDIPYTLIKSIGILMVSTSSESIAAQARELLNNFRTDQDLNSRVGPLIDKYLSIDSPSVLAQQEIEQKTKKSWIKSLILTRLSDTNVNKEYLDRLAEDISSRWDIFFIKDLFRSLRRIENLIDFQSLVDFIDKHKIQEFEFGENIFELRRELEIGLLQDYFIFHEPFKTHDVIKKLFDLGWVVDELNDLFLASQLIKENRKIEDRLFHVLVIMSHYGLLPVHLSKIREILRENVPEAWVKKINALAIENTFQQSENFKSVQDLVGEFERLNSKTLLEGSFFSEQLLSPIQQIKSKDLTAEFISSIPIFQWDQSMILEWVKKVRLDPDYFHNSNYLIQMIAVMYRANYLATGFYLNDSQILSILVALQSKQACGHLLQVATGEGKTVIVSMLAIFYALQGKKVDVITSSPVHAEEGVKSQTKLYQLFGLTVSENSDKTTYMRGSKSCYKSDIVYGEVAQFQFDCLRDEYSGLDTLAGRKSEIALVDEVDSMLLDESTKIAKLASIVPGIDQLQPIYHLLWERLTLLLDKLVIIDGQMYLFHGVVQQEGDSFTLQYDENGEHKTISDLVSYLQTTKDISSIGVHINENIDELIELELRTYLQAKIEDGTVKIPSHLKEFVNTQVSRWVKSAIQALSYQEKVHYVIQYGRINPVNYDSNGVVEHFTNWGDGLHQFLQIKHGLEVTSENFTTNFLSTVGYFRRYGKNLIGLTGTLGSEKSREILQEVYHVDCAYIPSLREKQFLVLSPIVSEDHTQWLNEICFSTTHELQKERGVLIVCETIKQAELIEQELKSKYKIHQVKSYTQNGCDQEAEIRSITPGDVFVVTNLGGRGTDINTVLLEESGGMHVIVTFMPVNKRVEEQAFGRTSRQGRRGTAQIITNTLDLPRNDTPHNPETCFQSRDDDESKRLELFFNEKLAVIEAKDKLFKRFCLLLAELREKIRAKTDGFIRRLQKLFKDSPTAYEYNCLAAVEERWAIFLHQINFDTLSTSEAEYEKFEQQIFAGYEADQLIQNPCYHIAVANDIIVHSSLTKENYTTAMKHLDEVTKNKEDSVFYASAFVGKAWLLLKSKGEYLEKDMEGKQKPGEYKRLAQEMLLRAMLSLTEEASALYAVQVITQRGDVDPSCALLHQLQKKMSIIGSYKNSIERMIHVIKKSRRLITLSYIEMDKKSTEVEARSQPYQQETVYYDLDRSVGQEVEVPVAKGTVRKFSVTFNGLTKREDGLHTIDQAVDTISNTISDGSLSFFSSKKKLSSQYRNIQLDLMPISLANLKINKEINWETLWSKAESVHVAFSALSSEMATKKLTQIAAKKIDIELSASADKLISLLGNVDMQMVKLQTTDTTFETLSIKEAIKILSETKKESATIKIQELTKEDSVKLLSHMQDIPVNITFNDIYWRETVFDEDQANIRFTGLGKTEAIDVITQLRKEDVDFDLSFHELSEEQAKGVIQVANLEQEDIAISQAKYLADLFTFGIQPEIEIREFSARGMEYLLEVNEKKFIPWRSICSIVMLSGIQMLAGAVLISTGFGANVGLGIMTEGAADLVNAIRILATRDFSWNAYLKQKAVSLVISAMSMGWQALKDAGMGMKTLVSGVKQEVKEQVLVNMVSNGKQLGTSLIEYGRSLQSLAVKQMGVAVGEAGAREVLNQAVDALSHLCLDQFKPQVSEYVQGQVATKFCETALAKRLFRMYAIDTMLGGQSYQNRVEMTVKELVNPHNSFWRKQWDSIGRPLCTGILSSKHYLGNPLSMGIRILDTLKGMHEIVYIIDKLHEELLEKIEQRNKEVFSLVSLLSRFCDMTKEEAEGITNILKKATIIDSIEGLNPSAFQSSSQTSTSKERLIDQVRFGEQYEKHRLSVVKFLTNLYQTTSHLQSRDLNPTLRIISDTITDQIFRATESSLISPWSSYGVGMFVSAASRKVQNAIIQSQREKEKKKIMEKYEQLSGKADKTAEDINKLVSLRMDFYRLHPETQEMEEKYEQLSKRENKTGEEQDEMLFLKQAIEQEITFENLILEEARIYSGLYCQASSLISASQMEKIGEVDCGDKRIISYTKAIVEEGSPAGAVEMQVMAKRNDIMLKIVDEKYQMTEVDKQQGVKIIGFISASSLSESSNGLGHWMLMDASGNWMNLGNDGNNCGYIIFSKLTGKSIEQLRQETAQSICGNGKFFAHILENTDYIESHYPQEKDDLLYRGGWGADVHGGCTLQWCEEMGSDDLLPDVVANSCAGVDTGGTDPVSCFFSEEAQGWHFNVNGKQDGGVDDTRIKHTVESLNNAIDIKNSKEEVVSTKRPMGTGNESFKGPRKWVASITLGEGLHPIQDTFAHTKMWVSSGVKLFFGIKISDVRYHLEKSTDDPKKLKDSKRSPLSLEPGDAKEGYSQRLTNTRLLTKFILKCYHENRKLTVFELSQYATEALEIARYTERGGATPKEIERYQQFKAKLEQSSSDCQSKCASSPR